MYTELIYNYDWWKPKFRTWKKQMKQEVTSLKK